jgi:DNA-binding transcriptional LysR family regulator
MWETVDLREIRVFLTLAEELHFGRTAERLHLSQSRVSHALRNLESRVGGRLFERTSRHVELTALGEQLRAGIAPAYEHMRRAFGDVREAAAGVTGPVRIGAHSPVDLGERFLDVLQAFESRFPGARVAPIDIGLAREPCEWLRTGDVDMLALRLPCTEPDITVGPVLSHEPRVLLVARGDPLAAAEQVSIEDFADRAVAGAPALRREVAGVGGPRVEAGSLAEVVLRVAAGELVHPAVPSFTRHYGHPEVVAVPIAGLPPSDTALVWPAAARSPKVRRFAETAREVLASHSNASQEVASWEEVR